MRWNSIVYCRLISQSEAAEYPQPRATANPAGRRFIVPHHRRRLRGDTTGHFVIEEHLAVSTLRILTRDVLRAVDTDSPDRGHGDSETAEVGPQVRRGETAAEFDDRQWLTSSVCAHRHPVDRRQLRRRIARHHRPGGDDEIGPCLRAIIEAEYGDHDTVERRRRARTAASLAVGDAVTRCRICTLHGFERGAEELFERRARLFDAEPASRRCVLSREPATLALRRRSGVGNFPAVPHDVLSCRQLPVLVE